MAGWNDFAIVRVLSATNRTCFRIPSSDFRVQESSGPRPFSSISSSSLRAGERLTDLVVEHEGALALFLFAGVDQAHRQAR